MSQYNWFSVGCLFLLISRVWAQNPPRTQEEVRFAHDIHLQAGETRAEATCMHCSIYVAGNISGDVVAIRGNVILESGASIGGDVTTVLGDVRLHSGSNVGGDVTAVAGVVRRETQTAVGGDTTSLEGTKWLAAIILPPFFVLGLIVALIVWLVQRRRRITLASEPIPTSH